MIRIADVHIEMMKINFALIVFEDDRFAKMEATRSDVEEAFDTVS